MMMHLRIQNTTRVLGKSQGYLGLHVRDIVFDDGTTGMQTAWEPTPDELKALNEGKSIIIQLLGSEHPPIKVNVGDE